VTLVDTRSAPIQEITPTGIRTTKAEFAVDAIAFATGFDAMTGALREIDISGVNDQKMSRKWTSGPQTYLGLMVAGFPNLFIITGPGSPSVKSNMVCSIEQHVEWIADCIAFLERHELSSIEASDEAEQDWVAHVNDVANKTLYPVANSWYSGSNIPGKPRVFMPYVGGLATYNKICEDVVANGYRGFILGSPTRPHPNRIAADRKGEPELNPAK
jgi:cyclohexanone monooxygenase